MGGGSPSEAQISAAVDSLSEVGFQVLAEQFVRLRDPRLFGQLSPVGRNEKLRPTRGWGDGRVNLNDGRMLVVEATTQAKPERHLLADTRAIARDFRGRIAGFVFVSCGPEPSAELIAKRRRDLVAAGAPADSTELIFRPLLLRELSEPRFATIWATLGLGVTPWPFRLIDEVSEIYGSANDADRFVPSRSDFERGRVPWLDMHREVFAAIRTERSMVVRGNRGSGKTLLGAQVGLGWRCLGLPAFYLDVASYLDKAGPVFDAVDSRSDAGVLFILDNVHVDERLAAEVVRHCDIRDDGGALLLLGRPATASRFGSSLPLEDLEIGERKLVSGPETIAAVFEQEFRRHGLRPMREPTPQDFERWSSLFGEDMLTLIAALRKRMQSLAAGDLRLARADALDYVRKHYLHPTDAAINSGLSSLAVVSQLEMTMPEALVGAKIIIHARARGLLKTYRDRHPGDLRYSLPHPALSALILADVKPDDEARLLSWIARRAPAMLPKMILRLRQQRSPISVGAVIRGAMDARGSQAVEALTMQDLAMVIEEAQKSEAVSMKRLDELLTAEPEIIQRLIQLGGAQALEPVVRRVQKRLPRTEVLIRRTLDDPALARSYAEDGMKRGPGAVRQNLAFWRKAKLQQLVDAQVALLGNRSAVEALVDQAVDRGSQAVGDIVRIAVSGVPEVALEMERRLKGSQGERTMVEILDRGSLGSANYLLKGLPREERLRRRIAELLKRPLCQAKTERLMWEGNLADLGDFVVATTIVGLSGWCFRTIAEPSYRDHLIASIRESPLRYMPNLLRRIRTRVPELHNAIGESLEEPEMVDHAVQRLLERPRRLIGLSEFFGYAEGHLPGVLDAFLWRLSDEDVVVPLAEAISRFDRLADVTAFVGLLDRRLPETTNEVGRTAIAKPHLDRLIFLMLRADDRELLGFTETVDFSGEIWRRLPESAWNEICNRPRMRGNAGREIGAFLADLALARESLAPPPSGVVSGAD
jgi:hypothetical protein